MKQPYAKDAFWFSKLRVYRQCPYLYKLQFIDGVKIESRSLDTEFGTALNLGLDAIVNQESDGLDIFNMYWETTPRNLQRFRYDWEMLAKMGPVFLHKFRESQAKHYEPILVGERVYGNVGKHAFEGEPDFYGKYKGKLTVIDFKTAGKNYPKQKIISDEQMVGYAHLLEQNGHKPAEQVMYQVLKKDPKEPSLQNPIILPLTAEHKCNILSNIEHTCDEIVARTVFTKNPDAYFFGEVVSPYFEMVFGKGVKNEG
jgi:hypothetical protein